jgi:hypothetical protein
MMLAGNFWIGFGIGGNGVGNEMEFRRGGKWLVAAVGSSSHSKTMTDMLLSHESNGALFFIKD